MSHKKRSYQAPFIHTVMTAPYIYLTHIAALLPCVVTGIIFYGISTLVLIVLCAGSFMILDYAFGRMVRRDGIDRNYTDFSSIEAGVIYALMLPPGTSVIVALTGVLFGSFVVKQFFGGSGNNILNPACVARLCIELLFPTGMAGYKTPMSSWFDVSTLVRGAAGSPDVIVSRDDTSVLYFVELLTGNYAGAIGMTCALLIIGAGVYQALKGTIRIYAPLAYLMTLALLFPIISANLDLQITGFRSLGVFILSSGCLYVACYMLGDFTTMPSRIWGGIVAGVMCAVMTTILYGRVPDTCALLAPVMATNFMAFEIDFFTKTIARRGKSRQREVEYRG
ncbi:NQR2, RnfD, RnfE family [Ruminococcaceae bacterium YRB3002]|nr:NQR2, RnfD, RnfE family [Ruminococcaceae bacterium YRB3002]